MNRRIRNIRSFIINQSHPWINGGILGFLARLYGPLPLPIKSHSNYPTSKRKGESVMRHPYNAESKRQADADFMSGEQKKHYGRKDDDMCATPDQMISARSQPVGF